MNFHFKIMNEEEYYNKTERLEEPEQSTLEEYDIHREYLLTNNNLCQNPQTLPLTT